MDRLLKLGVGGIFFLLPLFFLLPPVANTIEAQLIGSKFLLCFYLGSVSIAALVAWRGQYYLALIHGLISINVLFFFLGVNQLYAYVYWVAALGAALLFCSLESDVQEVCLRAVVYAAVVSSVLGIFQAMDLDPLLSYASSITEADRRLPAGLMGQATKHGALLAMALGMALGLRQWVALGIILIGVALTNSSFTWLAAGGAFIVWVRWEYGRAMVIGAVLAASIGALLLFLFSPQYAMDHGRFAVWEASLNAWWYGPRLLGFGLGSFAAPVGPGKTFFAEYFQPTHLRQYGDFVQAHNDYVQVVFEMGVLGIIGLVAGAGFLGLHYWRRWWRGEWERPVIVAAQCGIVAILLNALGNFPFQLAPHYLLAVIFVALLLGKPRYNKT